MRCRDMLTSKRIGDCKFYLSCEEGDTACPVTPQRWRGTPNGCAAEPARYCGTARPSGH